MKLGKSEGKRWLELIRKREKLEGTKIIRMVKHLTVSHYALNINYKELSSAISSYERDLSIWATKNRPKLDAFLREFSRLLHNYLASLFSLIEHTRGFCRDLGNPQLYEEYEREVERIRINEVIIFLKDLRTYTQHYRFPFVSALLQFKAIKPGKGTMEQNLVLDKESLLSWKGWTSTSRKYLETYEKDIDLKDVVSEYQSLVSGFYDWFYKRVVDLYSEQLRELLELEKQIHILEQSGNTIPS